MNIVGGTMSSIYGTMSIVDGTMNIDGSSIYGTMRINGGTMCNGCKVVQPCTFTDSTTFTDSMHIYGFKVPFAFLMIPPPCDHLIILVLYVDNHFITSNDHNLLIHVKSSLKKKVRRNLK